MHEHGPVVLVLESPTATQVLALGHATEDRPETTEPAGAGVATIRQEELATGVGPPDRKMAASMEASTRENMPHLSSVGGLSQARLVQCKSASAASMARWNV